MADTTSHVRSATTVADLIATGGRALPAERVGDAQALISWILNTMCPNKVRERASNLRQALSVDAPAKPAGPAVVHSSPAELREFAQNVITDINSGIAYTADEIAEHIERYFVVPAPSEHVSDVTGYMVLNPENTADLWDGVVHTTLEAVRQEMAHAKQRKNDVGEGWAIYEVRPLGESTVSKE